MIQLPQQASDSSDARSTRRIFKNRHRGFSMFEMIWVVSLLGILAALALAQYGTMSEGSKLSVATEKLERLNQGLIGYGTVVSDAAAYYPAPRADGGDENFVLLSLQFRHSTNPTVGAPYVDARYRPDTSSDSTEYRYQWSGTMFKLLVPGQSGTGLLEPFDGSDMKAPFPFTDNFRPLGR